MDEETGTDLTASADPVAAPEPVAEDTATSITESVEQTPDLDRLISDLEKNWDKIPAEKRAALDKSFQPAFNRRVNFLNTALENGFKSAGIQMPEGKTALDLVTENDGKGLGEYFSSLVKSEVAPVKQAIETAQFNQNLQTARDMAIADMPDIKDHVEKAIPIIEQTPDLLKYVTETGGRGLYRALQSVGMYLENQRLKSLLEQNRIATRTSAGTTRAGAGVPKQTQQPKAKTLKEAAEMAMKMVKADLEAEA